MTNKQKAKLLRDLAAVYDQYDKMCDIDVEFDNWCDKYDKLFLKLLDLVVEECTGNGMLGNLFKRLSTYIDRVCNSKGKLL